MLRLLTIVCALLVLAGCSGRKMSVVKKDYHGHFSSAGGDFHFLVPTDWEIREGLPGQVVVARSPMESVQDQFRENLVVVEPVPGKDAGDARDLAAASLAHQFQGSFKEASRGDGPLPGSKFLVYRYSTDGEQLWAKSYFFVASGGNVMVTCTAAQAHSDEWVKPFDKILETFALGPDPNPPAPDDTASPGASASPAAAATTTASSTPAPTASGAKVESPSASPQIPASATPAAQSNRPSPTPSAK
jgi:hypothetical protein